MSNVWICKVPGIHAFKKCEEPYQRRRCRKYLSSINADMFKFQSAGWILIKYKMEEYEYQWQVHMCFVLILYVKKKFSRTYHLYVF